MNLKVEYLNANKLKATNLTFNPKNCGWENRPDTAIRPEMLNIVDERIVDFTPEKIKSKFTNCKNCGAPLKSDECEYCGTQYGKGVEE